MTNRTTDKCRDSGPSVLRLAGGAALVLAGGLAAAGLLGLRFGLWGRGPAGPRPVPGDVVSAGAEADVGAAAWRSSSTSAAGAARGAAPPYEPRDAMGQGGEAHTDAALLAAWDRLERRIAAAMARARESVVALEYTAADAPAGTRRVATGVVINNRGEILSVRIDPPPARPAPGTRKNLAPIVARDSSGRRHAAQWVAADAETGLTLLRVSPRAVRPIRTAADGPKLGSQVFVVGNPFGMGHSVSRGHVAGLDRALELGNGELGGLIQVQAPLYPGDSGAAVVDLRGDWLGLIRSGLAIPGSASVSDSGPTPSPGLLGSASPAGLSPPADLVDPDDDVATAAPGRPEPDTHFGFAIPTRDALWVADQLRTHGRVDRAYLGVRLEPMISAPGPPAPSEPVSGPKPGSIDPRPVSGSPVSAMISIEPDGALAPTAGDGAVLREVLAGTPAARAGLRPGDHIVALDGQPILSPHDLIDRLDRIPSRATIRLSVLRGDDPRRERIALTLQTASRPGPPLASLGSPPPAPGSESSRASVPVTPTAARSIPAVPATADPASLPSRDSTRRPGAALASPSANPDPTLPDRAEAAIPIATPPLNELRLTLPRAVVERLEQFERRLEKLETFSTPASHRGATPNRQAGSNRKP